MRRVKELRTSKFYGVRIDQRKQKETIKYYFRAQISAENQKYDLGIYTKEAHAAYAFNIGFSILQNGQFKIENFVTLNHDEEKFIANKVERMIEKQKLKNEYL